LIKRGSRVRVYDDREKPGSSAVAAGIFNPFTGRKLVKTWMADTLFPCLIDYYRELEHDLGLGLIHHIPMYRPFLSVDEQNDWSAKLYDDRYSQYIESIISSEEPIPQVKSPLGGIMLKKCGFVDTGILISAIRDYLVNRNAFSDSCFDLSQLQIQQKGVIYRGQKAQKVIFCEGPWLDNNAYFNWLPLRPVKGELLEIELAEPLDLIVNRGVFVLPYRGNVCKVGATFDQHDHSWTVTDRAKQQLEEGLRALLTVPFKITRQLAGIRPASSDRRPLIGLHPEYEPLAVFNGLGTKGVSLAPYLIREFYEFLRYRKPLIGDVAINRHFSLYYNKI
jgi:glycine/D-amino acid oxidase-like deaminating enzyme